MAERKEWWEILRDQFASRGLLDPESERVQEAVQAAPAAQRQARGLLSLDPQAESDTVLEMGLGSLPGTGQLMALRDLERARRAGDPAGMAMAATEFVPFGRIGGALRRDIFIGKNAKTWNKKTANRAVEMEKEGKFPENIWRETGTFRGPDGEWRQEIVDEDSYLRQEPDINAAIDQRKAQIAAINQQVRQIRQATKTQPDLFPKELNRSIRELTQTKKPLQEEIKGNYGLEFGKTGYLGSRARLAMHHPEAFYAYPDLGQDLIIRRNQPLGAETRGAYYPSESRIDIGSSVTGKPSRASSIALHELQHAIQQREGFAKGGSPSEFQPKVLQGKAAEAKADLSKVLTGGMSSSTREVIDLFDYAPQESLLQISKKYGFDDPNDLRNFLIKEQNKTSPFEQYRRLAGEAEARAVQGRESLDAFFRRKVFPLQSYDVPIDELIIRR